MAYQPADIARGRVVLGRTGLTGMHARMCRAPELVGLGVYHSDKVSSAVDHTASGFLSGFAGISREAKTWVQTVLARPVFSRCHYSGQIRFQDQYYDVYGNSPSDRRFHMELLATQGMHANRRHRSMLPGIRWGPRGNDGTTQHSKEASPDQEGFWR